MSKVNLDYLSALSKMTLTDSEKTQFENDFDKIIDFVSEIKDVDTSMVSNKASTITIGDLREDKVEPSMDRVAVLQNAPKQKDGCYVTPLVVE